MKDRRVAEGKGRPRPKRRARYKSDSEVNSEVCVFRIVRTSRATGKEDIFAC